MEVVLSLICKIVVIVEFVVAYVNLNKDYFIKDATWKQVVETGILTKYIKFLYDR